MIEHLLDHQPQQHNQHPRHNEYEYKAPLRRPAL